LFYPQEKKTNEEGWQILFKKPILQMSNWNLEMSYGQC